MAGVSWVLGACGVSTARYIVGDSLTVLRSMPDASVDCVVTSPPYHLQRAYLPAEHPDRPLEMGQEPTPALFLENLLIVMDELWRVLTDHGTFWVNLGDKHAGSGGAGGDYDEGGMREGQNRYGRPRYANPEQNGGPMRDRALDEAMGRIPPGSGKRWKTKPGWPLEQSVAWEPHLFGASLAYGRNLLTGDQHRQWITRPPITWCKPSVSPGSLTRRFRSATELIIYGGKRADHYFDLDAVRLEPVLSNDRTTWNQNGPKALAARAAGKDVSGHERYTQRTVNPAGSPPLNWWLIGHGGGYPEAHFATFPPELIVKPIKAGCPPGGTVLDPFAGSGTTLAVATGHGRDAIGIDLDARNADLARARVGMFLTVESPATEVPA